MTKLNATQNVARPLSSARQAPPTPTKPKLLLAEDRFEKKNEGVQRQKKSAAATGGMRQTMPPSTKSKPRKGIAHHQRASPPEVIDSPNVIDATKRINTEVVKGAIDSVANESGERGNINLHIEGQGRNGALTFGASGDLDFNIEKTDTGALTLGMNWELAGKVGFDVGFAKGDLEVGVGGEKRLRFKDSEQAAKWVTGQLAKMNDKSGGRLLDVQRPRGSSQSPTVITSTSHHTEVRGEAGSDRVKVHGKARRQSESQTFEQGGRVYRGNRVTTVLQGGIDIELKNGIKVSGQYTRTDIDQRGDPRHENNGQYLNRRLDISFSQEQLQKMDLSNNQTAQTIIEARRAAFGGYRNGNAQMLQQAKNLNEQLKSLREGNYSKSEGKITLSFESNYVRENGEYKNQYNRGFISGSISAERGVKTPLAELKMSASASKSERIYEKIGNKTETYANQQFMHNDWPTWNAFKAKNRRSIEQIVDERIKNAPHGSVARAFAKNQNYDEGIRALEQDWIKEGKRFSDAKRKGAEISAYENHFRVSYAEEKKILREMRKFEHDPKALKMLMDSIQANGWDYSEMRNRFNSDTRRELNYLIGLAHQRGR